MVDNSSTTVGTWTFSNSDLNAPYIISPSVSTNVNFTDDVITGGTSGIIRTNGTPTINAVFKGVSLLSGSVYFVAASGTPVKNVKVVDAQLGVLDIGTVPTITGCGTISAQTGGRTNGTFTTNTTGTCAAAFALPTAPNGWACYVQDITQHVAVNIMMQSVTAVSSCTVTGTTAASDVLTFTAIPY
jgi:hypothetical protein